MEDTILFFITIAVAIIATVTKQEHSVIAIVTMATILIVCLLRLTQKIYNEYSTYSAIKKVAEYAREELCIEKHLPIIRITEIPDTNKGEMVCGCFEFFKWTLTINSRYIEMKGGVNYDVEGTVMHEMRHAWQWLRYPEVCLWWSARPEMYKYFYWTDNVLEYDARLYDDNHGDELIGKFALDDFEENFELRTSELEVKYMKAKLQESSRE